METRSGAGQAAVATAAAAAAAARKATTKDGSPRLTWLLDNGSTCHIADELEVLPWPNALLVRARGNLDIYTSPEFRLALDDSRKEGKRHFIPCFFYRNM